MNDILEVRHLVKRFGDVTAVDDLSFRVREGELFAFLGVNGAGKSTTIHILCGQLARDGGSVMLALFGGFVYAGLLPLAYFLGASALGLSACLGIYLGLTLALSAVLYVWLRRRGAAVFAAL